MILDTFNHISKSTLICAKIYVKIDTFFLDQIKSLIRNKYGTLKNFNLRELNISYATLRYEFQKAKYHPLNRLLKILNYECNLTFRKNRPGMWSIYIGANQLRKFHQKISFGTHKKRNNILKAAAGKKLRVNQYC